MTWFPKIEMAPSRKVSDECASARRRRRQDRQRLVGALHQGGIQADRDCAVSDPPQNHQPPTTTRGATSARRTRVRSVASDRPGVQPDARLWTRIQHTHRS